MQISPLQRSVRLREDLGAMFIGKAAADDRRVSMAAASHGLVLQHHFAITVLTEKLLHGSAAALLRPLYEACVNGLWLTYLADEQNLDAFEANRSPPDPSKVLRKLRSRIDAESVAFLERLHAQAIDALNSYVHTGGLQVMRHIGPTMIGPNFSQVEIAECLEFANLVFITSALELRTLLDVQCDQAIEEVLCRYKPEQFQDKTPTA